MSDGDSLWKNTIQNSYTYKALKNNAADALNRLDIVDTNNSIKPNKLSLAEHCSAEKEDVPYLVNYKIIMQYQQNNKALI